MAVGARALTDLGTIAGVRLASAAAGIRYPNRQDLVLLELDPASHCAAVFTRNAFCAAPVTLARAHLATHSPRFLLVNSGNANAGTGTRGLDDARACCARLAELAGCEAEQVLPFSTGVIGEFLPVERFRAALPEALARLRADGWRPAAEAIRTTDTVAKGTTRRFDVRGIPVTITGIAKGAGMIRPDMATMLAFLATDAPVEQPVLQGLLAAAVAETFNRITVDGDTSTNDACVLIATGAAALPPIDRSDAEVYRMLAEQVHAVCLDLAQAIVRDGEGATKFITVRVSGAASEAECQTVAYTIAHSPLVKTACFASDPNWGRILAAVGRSGAAGLDIGQVAIHLDQTCVVRGGARSPDYREEQGRAVMGQEEFTIHVDLGRGTNATTLWTTDLSFDYVRINAEYRT